MLSKDDQEDHVKKGLCFKCHKFGYQIFDCLTFKIRIATLELEQEDDDG